MTDPVLGDAASDAALERLRGQLAGASPELDRALQAIARDDFAEAAQAAEAAAQARADDGPAWYVLGIAREKLGLFVPSLEAYERALALLPNHADLANDLGRLAARLGMPELAAPLFALHLSARPGSKEASVNLALALSEQCRYGEAVEVLKPAVQASADDPVLWNALGQVLLQQGEPQTALTFFDEALRLDPDFTPARFNRSAARLDLGDASGALVDCEAALAAPAGPEEVAVMGYARALTLLCAGKIAEGWEAYAARLSPDFSGSPRFLAGRPAWRPGAPLAGRSLLVVGEQGLGDEVMFASVLPDVVEALGPDGRLTLAVEPRLVELFRRSFPQAVVGAHSTDKSEAHPLRGVPFLAAPEAMDLWAPIGALLAAYRPDLDSFARPPGYLRPDPKAVERWRAWLAGLPAGPKVGVTWKSGMTGGERRRVYPPFEAWAPVLETPGAVFVNLQYGDASAEVAAAANAGIALHTPPGIDLKADLDDLAALTAALDLVIGVANATTQLSGAVGAPLRLLLAPAAWPALGSDRYPWHPQARVAHAPRFAWGEAMAEAAAELQGLLGR